MRRYRRIGPTLLLAAAVAGCAEEKPPRTPGTDAGTPAGGTPVGQTTAGTPVGTASDSGTPAGTTTTTTGTQTCQAAWLVAGYLDALQTPGTGTVTFCHRGPGATWTLVTIPVANCLAHLSHGADLFPTTLCDS